MICNPENIIVTDGDRVLSYETATSTLRAHPPSAGRGPGEILAEALKTLRTRRHAKTLFLSSTFFRQHVRLPKAQTDGLSPAELASLLAFEVEPFSNLSPETGLLAYRPLPGDDDGQGGWDVLQVAGTELGRIAKAARDAGATLAGVSGLPSEWDLSDEGALAEGLAGFTARLASGDPPLPLVVPPRGHSFSRRPFLLAALLAATLVLFCGVDYTVLAAKGARRAPLLAERQALVDENAALSARIRARENAIRARERERQEREEAARALAVLESAWVDSLVSMAGQFGENAVITAIRSDEDFRAVVEGVGASYKDVGDDLLRLSGPFAGQGWRLRPGSISAREDGSTARFSFSMVHEAAKEEKDARRSTDGGSFYDDYYDD